MPYFVYLLRCSDNTLYCGQTTDLKRRLKEHNSSAKNGARYTRTRRPVELIHSEKYQTLKEAMHREMEIKKWPRGKKLKLSGQR